MLFQQINGFLFITLIAFSLLMNGSLFENLQRTFEMANYQSKIRSKLLRGVNYRLKIVVNYCAQ